MNRRLWTKVLHFPTLRQELCFSKWDYSQLAIYLSFHHFIFSFLSSLFLWFFSSCHLFIRIYALHTYFADFRLYSGLLWSEGMGFNLFLFSFLFYLFACLFNEKFTLEQHVCGDWCTSVTPAWCCLTLTSVMTHVSQISTMSRENYEVFIYRSIVLSYLYITISNIPQQ